MTKFSVWLAVSSAVCIVGFVTGDARPAVVMYALSLLMPDETFLTEQ